ncbi:MAG: ATP-binding cassette domain-containing protein [Saprospiraceae bacterium]|nr:ATP-binding cassette domain-containing protein [Candidatus Defluviibacterium haderslevense]
MLKVENITTGYGKKQVLFDVSFEVKQGEIVLIAGSNGSGKSTLLKAIYGMLPQWNNGQIIFDGDNITGKPTSALLKKGILYIPQKNNLFEDLTVKENLEMAGLTLNQQILQQRIENALSIFITLEPHLHRTPMKLSGGERQLLTLAMAILHEPKMILVDEPFTGLSPQNITFVSENLRELNHANGITLLIVEHRVKECVPIANRIIGLKLGKVFRESEVKANFDIKELNSVFV